MKTAGLLGGMSWESTLVYYRIVNELVAERLGGLHSAQVLLYSVDFSVVERMQSAGDWQAAAKLLGDAGRALATAGADFLVICTNTMHIVADEIELAAGLPLVHIADATGGAVAAKGLRTVGLLGTRFTMERDFYRGRLAERFGLCVLVPDEADREAIHRVVYDELCKGVVREESRRAFAAIVERLAARGAEGIILGCTEIPMLVRPGDVRVPVFDTTRIHAAAAVERMLAGGLRAVR